MAFPFEKKACQKTVTLKECSDISCEFEVLPHIFNSYAVLFCPSLNIHTFTTRGVESNEDDKWIYTKEGDSLYELEYLCSDIGRWVDDQNNNYGTWTAEGYYDGYPIIIRGWADCGYNYIEYMYEPTQEENIKCLVQEVKACETAAKNKYRYIFDHYFPVEHHPDCWIINEDQKKILQPIASIIREKLFLNVNYPSAWHVLINKNTQYPYLEIGKDNGVSITLFADGTHAENYCDQIGCETYRTLVKAWEMQYFMAQMNIECGVTNFKFNYDGFDEEEEYWGSDFEDERDLQNPEYEKEEIDRLLFSDIEDVIDEQSNNSLRDYKYDELIDFIGMVHEIPKYEPPKIQDPADNPWPF